VKKIEECWKRVGFVDEALDRAIIQFWESSDHGNTVEEFWTPSEDW
jgi:hypothetical protein